MGFDLMGIYPKNKTGEYFRNNIWWWRRLWDFTCHVADVDDDTHGNGHLNNGIRIEKEQKDKMLRELKKANANRKKYKKWLQENEKELTAMSKLIDDMFKIPEKERTILHYPFTWKNVTDFIKFLENNKGFIIY